MKIIFKDLKRGILKVKIDSAEDAWYLSSIIEPGDIISGMTERKIKLGGSEEKSKISKRVMYLKITVDKIDQDNGLRISGPIIEAPDDIPKGDFHTFAADLNTVLTVEKESWGAYALKKLDEAVKSGSINILVVAFDREEALFALLKNNGYETLLDMKGDVAKKDFEEKKGNFYAEISKQVADYDKKYSFTNIIIASPAFWKEYLMKELDDAIKKKVTLATCSGIDGSTINEILKRPELKTVLEKDRSAKESALMEMLLEAIRKDNAAYGIEQVKEKIVRGNISVLMVSDSLIKKSRSEGTYKIIDKIMNDAEALDADVKIISGEDSMKKLDGLSGIAALLRWKEHYD